MSRSSAARDRERDADGPLQGEEALSSLLRGLLVLVVAGAPAACVSGADAGGSEDASAAPDVERVEHPDLDSGADAARDATARPPMLVDGSTTPSADPYGFFDSACDPQYVPGSADGSGCEYSQRLPCGLPPASATEGCYLLLTQCAVLCNESVTAVPACAISECLAVDASSVPDATPLTLECTTGMAGCAPGVGRRPRGLQPAALVGSAGAVGDALATMAHLEAASVHAFARLARQLASLGAPAALVREARCCARDETRHARAMARLARRRGARPPAVVLGPEKPVASIVAFAVENAVEGCVRETFGALVAMHQASHAAEADVAEEMTRIARDETRHAAFSWEIARWLAPRLDDAGQAHVLNAATRALSFIRSEIDRTRPDVARPLGFPTGDVARRLAVAFAKPSSRMFARMLSPVQATEMAGDPC